MLLCKIWEILSFQSAEAKAVFLKGFKRETVLNVLNHYREIIYFYFHVKRQSELSCLIFASLRKFLEVKEMFWPLASEPLITAKYYGTRGLGSSSSSEAPWFHWALLRDSSPQSAPCLPGNSMHLFSANGTKSVRWNLNLLFVIKLLATVMWCTSYDFKIALLYCCTPLVKMGLSEALRHLLLDPKPVKANKTFSTDLKYRTPQSEIDIECY